MTYASQTLDDNSLTKVSFGGESFATNNNFSIDANMATFLAGV